MGLYSIMVCGCVADPIRTKSVEIALPKNLYGMERVLIFCAPYGIVKAQRVLASEADGVPWNAGVRFPLVNLYNI